MEKKVKTCIIIVNFTAMENQLKLTNSWIGIKEYRWHYDNLIFLGNREIHALCIDKEPQFQFSTSVFGGAHFLSMKA